ncbi:MAG: aldo/keto reductase [Actinomycetota bacterium]
MTRPRLGLGTAPLANLFTSVTEEDAIATIDAAWANGIRYFDTAPQYGHGLGETRLGRALAHRPRDEFVLCSKVGRVLRRTDASRPSSAFVEIPDVDPVFDFSADGIRRSLEESLVRLGVDRLDVVHLHDPDLHEATALEESFPALIRLRDEGLIDRIGCGMNQWQMLSRFVERVPLDCVLLAGRWTLLDRSGGPLLEMCASHGVEVILGGVFNSGLLADPTGRPTFDYSLASPDKIELVSRMAEVCAQFGVALPAAAIGFAMRHRAVGAVLFGARSPAEIIADVQFAEMSFPDELWEGIDTLL